MSHRNLSCPEGFHSLPVSLCVEQLQQQEVRRLQLQREQRQKIQDQGARRRQLDQSLRLKMKRLSREQQEELQLDMSILQTLLKQETDEKQEAAQRKVNAPGPSLRHVNRS